MFSNIVLTLAVTVTFFTGVAMVGLVAYRVMGEILDRKDAEIMRMLDVS